MILLDVDSIDPGSSSSRRCMVVVGFSTLENPLIFHDSASLAPLTRRPTSAKPDNLDLPGWSGPLELEQGGQHWPCCASHYRAQSYRYGWVSRTVRHESRGASDWQLPNFGVAILPWSLVYFQSIQLTDF